MYERTLFGVWVVRFKGWVFVGRGFRIEVLGFTSLFDAPGRDL